MMFWILMILLIQSGWLQVLRFDQCHSGWIQVVEGTTNVILLTCTTSNPLDDLTWSVDNIDPPSNKFKLSTCYSDLNCGVSSQIDYYKLTRPGNNYSHLELITPANISFLNKIFFSCSRGSGSDVVCNVDLIYPAVVSSCNIQVVRGQNKWSVNGSCNITKVFSSRGLYACFLMQKQNNSVDVNVANGTYNPVFSAPDALYGSGICAYTTEFPLDSATYVYSVTVVPGNKSTSAGIITVERAETPTSICETSNIPENSTVICTCQTLSVGKPEGRLLWLLRRTNSVNTVIAAGNTGVANLTMESPRLTRQESGLVFQCVVDWATNLTGIQYEINVTYGPDSVSIPENTTFYTDMTGSLQLNLTCLTTGVKPSSGLVFSWTGPCLQILQNTCTIKPRPPTNQNIAYTPQEVKCSVRNPYNNNISREATYTLDLKYPPSDIPKVTGHPDNGIIYANDILNLTCVINGGNPLVTRIELRCTKHNQTQTSGHSASLSFLVRDDVNTTLCVCSGQWIIPSYYTLNNSFQLVVSYPPSTPYISQNGNEKFPYFEGETAYIMCNIIQSWGNPTAEITWSGQRQSNVTISNLPSTLQLKYLTWLDNKRNITCTAKNNYTVSKHLDISNSTVLEVYYSPIISFLEGEDNDCVLSMDASQCSIKTSQRLEITCSAHSNPSPANITWREGNSSGTVISSNANLSIIADSSDHNAIYLCIVSTNKTHSNDSRLPLSTAKELTILITEMPGPTSDDSYVGRIVGGIVGGIVVIVLIAVIVLFVRRKQQDDKLNSSQQIQASPDIKSKDNYLLADGASEADQPLHVQSSDTHNANRDMDNERSISPPDEENNVYSKVNKTTKHETPLKTDAILSSDSSDLKRQKEKKAKERENKKKKKKNAENKKSIQHTAPLSMKPHREFVYENVEIASPSDSQNRQKMCIGSDQGLTYTTIQFTETQLNEARKPPPKQDPTTYASIDFSNKGV